MAGALPGESSHCGNSESGPSRSSQDRPEEGGRWYFSRKEIEENSPSRRDNIDLKKETYLRKSYCTFLQDLGMRLKVWVHVYIVFSSSFTDFWLIFFIMFQSLSDSAVNFHFIFVIAPSFIWGSCKVFFIVY
jgi:hypothetical protein